MNNNFYELKDDLKGVWSDGVLNDVFSGYLDPNDLLKNEKDIKEVTEALEIIRKYVETLDYSDKIEKA